MKNPKLKLKYSEGLGDVIACFLHSKYLSWLTKLITGREKPCKTCSERIYAFNILVPFSLWKFFFKTKKEFVENLQKELNLYFNDKGDDLNIENENDENHVSQTKTFKRPKIENHHGDYILLSSSDELLGEYLVRIQTYKKN